METEASSLVNLFKLNVLDPDRLTLEVIVLPTRKLGPVVGTCQNLDLISFLMVEKFLVRQLTDPDQLFQNLLIEEAMGTCHNQHLLFLFILGAPTLICMY